jgi:hypothetical protein
MSKLIPEEIAMMASRPMTLGEKRCHINFNPSSNDKIATFKRMIADAIDFLNEEGFGALTNEQRYEQSRCFNIAMEHLETAQMYGVKGIAKSLNSNQ